MWFPGSVSLLLWCVWPPALSRCAARGRPGTQTTAPSTATCGVTCWSPNSSSLLAPTKLSTQWVKRYWVICVVKCRGGLTIHTLCLHNYRFLYFAFSSSSLPGCVLHHCWSTALLAALCFLLVVSGGDWTIPAATGSFWRAKHQEKVFLPMWLLYSRAGGGRVCSHRLQRIRLKNCVCCLSVHTF